MDITKVKVSKNKKKTNKNKKNKKKKNNIKNYYYIGVNEKYNLCIVKKINSLLIDKITLHTWKLICIWNDIHNNYNLLTDIFLDMIINNNADYMLLNTKRNAFNDSSRDGFLTFKNVLQLMNIPKIGIRQLKSIETKYLHKILLNFETKSAIVDYNMINMIDDYLVSNIDIYLEIKQYTTDCPKQIMMHLYTNYNIYKICAVNFCEKYIAQIGIRFYECGESGFPKNRKYELDARYSVKDLLTDIEKNIINKDVVDVVNVVDVVDEIHDYKNCLPHCPANCRLKKIIRENLINISTHYVNTQTYYNKNKKNKKNTISIHKFDIRDMKFHYEFSYDIVKSTYDGNYYEEKKHDEIDSDYEDSYDEDNNEHPFD